MSFVGIIVLALIVIALIGGGIFLYLQQRTSRLRSRFGPEYDRTIRETGSRMRAESRLEHLEKRVDKLNIRPLTAEEANGFRESWRRIQAEFVDDPGKALSDADGLLGEVMSARGYPIVDFEERAAEISVDHAPVVENYRAGHGIARKQVDGEATTEERRQAMIHYRTLFDDLVGKPEIARARGA